MTFLEKTPEELVTYFSNGKKQKLIEHHMFEGALNNPAIGFRLSEYNIKRSEMYIDKKLTTVWWVTGGENVLTFIKNTETGLFVGNIVNIEVMGYDMMRLTVTCNMGDKTKLINALGNLLVL